MQWQLSSSARAAAVATAGAAFHHRLPNYFAACRAVYAHVAAVTPLFSPVSALDFGTGAGMALWATQDVWSPKMTVAIERSRSFSKDIDAVAKEHFPNPVRVQPSLSHLDESALFDLVTCAYTLAELTDPEQRAQTLLHLWQLTRGTLVLVEEGTSDGFALIEDYRRTILQLERNKIQNGGHSLAKVIAPCPHEYACPRRDNEKSPCTFKTRVQFTSEMASLFKIKSKNNFYNLQFSYVAITRDATDIVRHPRLINTPLKRDGHVIIDTCGRQGKLERTVVSKSKGKEQYTAARKSRWGNVWPYETDNNRPSDDQDKR